MNKPLFSVLSIALIGTFALGQAQTQKPNGTSSEATATTTIAITAETAPMDLARAAFMAQGGEKFRSVQNMMLRGSVNLYQPNSIQSIPGGFSIVTAGNKMRMEIDARPLIVFKQIYDGQQSYSSMPAVQVPPLPKFGLGVLAKFDQAGYKITALPDKKKQRAFRIEDPEGYITDFYVDPANGRVMSFLLYFNGFTFGTENKKFKEVEGVLVPVSFSQRFDMPQGAFFAEYSVKEAKLNQTLGDDAFAIPN